MSLTRMPSNSNSFFKLLSKDSGSAILFVLILAVILNVVIGAVSFTSRYSMKKSGVRRENVAALNIAEAGKERLLGDLRSRQFNPPANNTSMLYTDEPLGTGTYTVSCTTNTTNDTIRILSTGSTGKNTVKLETVASMAPDWKRWVRGAVTARYGIQTLGNIEVDGRDYDTVGGIFGTCLNAGGTVGVASGGVVSADGSSRIGGNYTAPQQPALPGQTVEQNIDTTGYPQTPEEVLGLPAGSLDAYKMTSAPPSNYFGIVYADQPYDFAGGILICHNDTWTASLGNYHGHFKGLIIADNVQHFNGGSSVLGAVFMLGKSAAGNCFGNGAARIHYSSRMLSKVLQPLYPGNRDVNVVEWREVQ